MERVASTLETLITRWRADPGGTYRSWFLWEERLKNFRSIRRGILEVIEEIDRGTFGVTYKGSSLETVVGSIAEQRQIFKGADHAFLWKPKLRIPDIYESPENQRAFGKFLDTCVCCSGADALVAAIRNLDQLDRVPRHARGHPAAQRRASGAALQRPRRGRRASLRRRQWTLPRTSS